MVLNCVICNSEFTRYGKQILIAKTCSKKCLGIYSKASPNTTCTCCGKNFHMKEFRKNAHKRTFGFYCSKECVYADRSVKFKGKLNHQFGLKGNKNSSFKGDEIERLNHTVVEIRVYAPNHPKKNRDNRVLKHRILVEDNYQLFDLDCFDDINGKFYLKSEYEVHHIDHNHLNNCISNLMPLSKSDHKKIHNKMKKIIRGDRGRILTTINL